MTRGASHHAHPASPALPPSPTSRSFDDSRGLECAQALSAEAISPDLRARYLALSSLAALVQYLQQIQQVALAARSMRFVWREPRGRMSLDYETVRLG